MRSCLATIVFAGVVLVGGNASADMWKFEDKDGVVHFTNIKPTGRNKRKWKRFLRDAPTKVAASRGACKGCDVIPPRDRSKERYQRFDAFILEASKLYQIPIPLIRAVIRTESDYDPRVVSSAGARGLMQLMPQVAVEMGVDNPHDPRQCVLGGTRLLRILANRFDGDLAKTIAAYHAGAGSLAKYGDEIPPYPKTRRYLKNVMERYRRYKAENSQLASAP